MILVKNIEERILYMNDLNIRINSIEKFIDYHRNIVGIIGIKYVNKVYKLFKNAFDLVNDKHVNSYYNWKRVKESKLSLPGFRGL